MIGNGQEYLIIILKLFLSTLFAGMVGLEREAHGRAAGLRTHILVSLGSCLIMLTSIHIFHVYKDVATCDPARIAAGVVTGVGFLGAGTILRYRTSVVGLTTAASIWAVAAIGLSIGAGFYIGGIMSTLFVMGTLVVISKWEHRVIRKGWYKNLIVEAKVDAALLQTVRNTLMDYKAVIKDFEIEPIPGKSESRLRFDIKLTIKKYDDIILNSLASLDNINKVYWEEFQR